MEGEELGSAGEGFDIADEGLGIASDLLVAGGLLFGRPELEAAGVMLSAIDKILDSSSESSDVVQATTESNQYYGSGPLSAESVSPALGGYHMGDSVAYLSENVSQGLSADPSYEAPNELLNAGSGLSSHQGYTFNGQEYSVSDYSENNLGVSDTGNNNTPLIDDHDSLLG